MFDNDLLLAFLFMAILFIRQIYILRQPNKINYAPLMLGVGAISSVVHFIANPEATNMLLLLRESLFPMLVGLLLYIVMNILHQTQVSENSRLQEEFTQALIDQISQLKEFTGELEDRMSAFMQEDRKAQEEIREKFKQDIKALDAIQTNQAKFLDKFNDLKAWHTDVTKEFEYFRTVQLPELDNVVHKHIDILRVAEQDHFNQVKATLQKALETRCDIADELEEVRAKMEGMKNISDDIAKSITRHTLQQLSGITDSFTKQIVSLKSHTEGVWTSLLEGESRLGNIRQESELIMKQMILSSKKMDKLHEQSRELHDLYDTVSILMKELESVKSDYIRSQSQLALVAKELRSAEEERLEAMKTQIDNLSQTLAAKVDESLKKLHEHYHIASEDISASVQMLAKKAQIIKGYSGQQS